MLGPGRHHATLVRLPDDRLVLTVIRRLDFDDGTLASYRRGCDAVVSRDHGETWDVEQRFVVDDFAALDDELWYHTINGQKCLISMEDGSLLAPLTPQRRRSPLAYPSQPIP